MSMDDQGVEDAAILLMSLGEEEAADSVPSENASG